MAFEEIFADLEEKSRRYSGGCAYELFASRMNMEVLNHAGAMPDAIRNSFLEAAAAKGFYEAEAPSGWLLEANSQTCAHGLDYDCCPCGCGDYKAELSIYSGA